MRFESLFNVERDEIEQEDNDEKEDTRATYRMVNFKLIENSINSMCVCKCNVNDSVSSFIEHCIENDDEISVAQMNKLFHGWKEKCELNVTKSKIKF